MELRLGVNRLGRNEANHFPIDHASVSAFHCELTWLDDDSFVVRDRDSTNGTFIDDKPIKEAKLSAGQTLRLGDLELVLDATLAAISVPDLSPKRKAPSRLPDGSAPCLNHAEARATRRCLQCQKAFCETCIHELHRIGGQKLKLCPVCSGQMEIIPGIDIARPKKKSLFARLRDTLKLSPKK